MLVVIADNLRGKIGEDIVRVLIWFFEVKGYEKSIFRLVKNNNYEEGNTELMIYIDDETTEIEYFVLKLEIPVDIYIMANLTSENEIILEEYV